MSIIGIGPAASELQTKLMQIGIAALVDLFCPGCGVQLPPGRLQGSDWVFDDDSRKWVHVPCGAKLEWRAEP